MSDVCRQCGNEYKEIGIHWSHSSSCSHPSFTDHQTEVIAGLLMGDGWIDSSSKLPRIVSEMTSQSYLEHVNEQLNIFGGCVSLKLTAEQNAKKSRGSGFNTDAKTENYSDLYVWSSMGHPELDEFADWYSSGKKVWPEEIELTSTVLKHWYCGDGNYDDSKNHDRIRIGIANEVNNLDKVDSIFENSGLPSPSNYNEYEYSDGRTNCIAQFTSSQSEELWKYMEEPLPDFDYKWPDRLK